MSLTQLSNKAVFPFIGKTNACWCHPGDYCVNECIGIDNLEDDVDTFKINISSGEDATI